MSWFKHSISDDCIRDSVTDNIVEETRVEKKSIFGIVYWSKTANETNEFVIVEKRKLGF